MKGYEMAGTAHDITEVAQADSLQEGEVVAPGAEHAPEGDAAHGATDAASGTTEATHAGTEEHSGAFPPFDGAYFGGQLLWLAITFGALYIIMSRVALPRIGSILETRRTRIEGDLREAERLRQETEKAAAAYEAALAEARKNAHAIAEETRAGIKADIEGRRADVEASLAKRVAEAEGRINAGKAQALTNVGAIAAETAQALVAKISGSVTAAEAKAAVAAVSKE
jgi:F-type H+-transporting ATPase subunit b